MVKVSDVVFDILFGFGWPLLLALVFATAHSAWRPWEKQWAFTALQGFTIWGVIGCFPRDHQVWREAVGSAAGFMLALAYRWWKRKGKKAAQALGAKALALREKLLERAREVAIPRPVLVPQRAWG